MNRPDPQQYPLIGLAAAAAVGAVAVLVAAFPPRMSVGPEREVTIGRQIEAPDARQLDERIPSANTVVEKHLFVPTRTATGQNSFPDLIVKGTFLGKEQSAVFSLKSKPQANLRIWFGDVENTLNSVTDPRDPRQPIVAFLREWPVKKIDWAGVTVEHFITGEAETYEVDYVAGKKVKDNAQRGYGQGVMPQDGGKVASAQKKQTSGNQKKSASPRPSLGTPGRAQFMADRVSGMLNSMSSQERQQFMNSLGVQSKNNSNSKNTNKKSSKKSQKKSSKKK